MATSPGAASAAPEEHDARYKWRVLASVVVGLFMVILDSTVVNVALKTLQNHFSVTTDQAQWVISLYTLALGISTPLSGYLGDRFGVKRIYLGGLALFVVGSLLSGFSSSFTSLPLLIMARTIQGIGGGIALPWAQRCSSAPSHLGSVVRPSAFSALCSSSHPPWDRCWVAGSLIATCCPGFSLSIFPSA